MKRKERRPSRLARWAKDTAGEAAARGADAVRKRARNLRAHAAHGGRFTCSCCPGKVFRGWRALNAHHLAVHYRQARAGRNGLPKAKRQAWLHARGHREAAGLVDKDGRMTDRGRTRPGVGGRVTLRELRAVSRHDRHHERADGLDRKAAAGPGRVARVLRRPDRSAAHANKASRLRDRHVPVPAARPVPRTDAPRPAPGPSREPRPAPGRPDPTRTRTR